MTPNHVSSDQPSPLSVAGLAMIMTGLFSMFDFESSQDMNRDELVGGWVGYLKRKAGDLALRPQPCVMQEG